MDMLLLLIKATFSTENSKFDITLTRYILNGCIHLATELFCSGLLCLFFLNSKF